MRVNEVLTLDDTKYNRHLRAIDVKKTHNGYFSIDKKSRRLVDPEAKLVKDFETGEKVLSSDDGDAYDLILKDKERLLSLEEPVRFIFSHSALREGWDNPNVFVICALKHSDNTVSRRQEVGRGMRISVNQLGERMDTPATVHQINVLTVVASESYKDFVAGLQQDISKSLSERPRLADEKYFTGKVLRTDTGDVEVTPVMAKAIYKYLLKNDYTDANDNIAEAYHVARQQGKLAELPPELSAHAPQVFQLIDSVFSARQLPQFEDNRKSKANPLNDNFHKKEFQELWGRINRKAAYTVHFDTPELVDKCVGALGKELKVTPLQYVIQRGEQIDGATVDNLKQGTAFRVSTTDTESYKGSVQSSVKYDLVGKLAEGTQLTRRTIAEVLSRISPTVFKQFRMNPEDFIAQSGRIINEQKATVIVEHIAYDPVAETHEMDIFTQAKPVSDFGRAVKVNRHVYDYVITDSENERNFVKELDTGTEVVVYAKLPKAFSIPTPVGNYNPDWAIAFQQGKVKHVYFVAETKGSMSTMDLRKIEESKIECARKFFAKITSDQVRYDVVTDYGKLMELVK